MNDLISREALLKAFANSEHIKETDSGLDVMEILAIKEIIDKAPSVPLPDFKEGYKQAILDGKTNFSRPQGEWVIFNSYYRKCNKCERMVGFDYADPEHGNWFNFCPNCGADMRGAE